jgi:hypothetical protein
MMEQWNDGMMGLEDFQSDFIKAISEITLIIPIFQHCNIPV